MSANQCHRLAAETEEEREAGLQRMSANQCHRLAAETEEEREARLMRDREGRRQQPSHLPLFEQPMVRAKMQKFHAQIAALMVQKCTTCSEAFPGLQLRSQSAECMRCSRDKHIPKLYSSMNNMDPGPVPQQLQVGSNHYTRTCS